MGIARLGTRPGYMAVKGAGCAARGSRAGARSVRSGL